MRFHDVRRALDAREPVSTDAKPACIVKTMDAGDKRPNDIQVGLNDIGCQSSKMNAKRARGGHVNSRISLNKVRMVIPFI